jgi:hypothetical protein
MTENKPGDRPNNPSNAELITAYFERLSITEKLAVFQDIVCSLSADLTELHDPVLNNSLDLLDTIEGNILDRVDEIAAVYGEIR